MCWQISSLLLFLLFPLALKAQQPQDLITYDSNLAVAARTVDTTADNRLPEAPAWRDEAEATPASLYVQPLSKADGSRPAAMYKGIWNKKFIAVNAAFLGSIVYDVELTHQGLAHHNCVEGNPLLNSHPTRGDLYRLNMLMFSAVTGIGWLSAKAKIPYIPSVGPVMGTVVHMSAGSKWLTQCW
jgi:hypothetical protein